MTGTLGLGVVGAGRVSADHAKAAQQLDGVALRAVAEVDETRRLTFAQRFACAGEASLDALLRRDDIDLVVLALPHRLHAEAAIQALQAGKHVLVEKPMAMSVEECDSMLDAAQRAGRLLAVGLTHHFHPVPAAARDLIRSGRLGRLAWATETQYSQRRLGSNPVWLFDRAEGGGQLLANGVHFLDRLMMLAGSRIVAVKALVGSFFNAYPSDDGTLAYFQFANGAAGTLALTGHFSGASTSLAQAVCTKGMLRYGKELEATDPDQPDVEAYRVVAVPPASGFARQLQNVAAAIRGEGALEAPGEWGRDVMRALFACEESSRSGREVLLP
ncbi:MAG: Gfo/Idh/MocA family protein [Chloroflexota bacterium]